LINSLYVFREVIELLLEADADPELADKAGRTPLWAAAAAGHASAVRALLFWGCCVDTIDQDGRTVLSVAAAQGGRLYKR
jgi:ankyrin repeat domain-containing protein 50